MSETTATPYTAAKLAHDFLRAYAPQEAEAAAPYLDKLFAALENGHAFVWADEADCRVLETLPLTVGSRGDTPLVLMGRRLFLGRMWQLERDLAAEIKRLAQAGAVEVDWMQAAQNLAQWFEGKGSEGQRDAAALALLQHFMLITGGPGTGKTTTVAKLLGLICANEHTLPRIALAAPTGKAAAHMARALHRALDGFDLPPRIAEHLRALEGQTVHRLLKLRPPQMLSPFGHAQPLPLDVLVVDEASMLDVSLLLQLLRAVPAGCRLIFLGDEFQLPSVGVGAVLAALSRDTVLDKATAERLAQYLPQHGFPVADAPPVLAQNVARLRFSHRFGADSGIGCLARAVVAGDAAGAWAQFDAFPRDLRVQQGSTAQQATQLYQRHEAYWQAVESGDLARVFGHAADVVALCAWRQDAEKLNAAYTVFLQKQGRAGAEPWFAGQVIMITQNDYTLELFNGDIGVMMPDAEAANGLAAFFPAAEGFRKVAVSRLPAYETAFAMTVHKSQGSEYREVWLLPPSAADTADDDVLSGLNNALLYTAITRARERFVFWGGEAQFAQAVETRKKRLTALDEMLNAAFRQG